MVGVERNGCTAGGELEKRVSVSVVMRARRELVPTDCWTPKFGGEGCPPASGELRLGRRLAILRSPSNEENELRRFGKEDLMIGAA
jgi:hypothetical protein